jgi:predicted TIM-barrel fold metal-dependent hydrolase
MDTDTHEMTPLHRWDDTFGRAVREFTELSRTMNTVNFAAENTIRRDDLQGDLTVISADTVWERKGPEAPGAFDFGRRHEVMDVQGIERALVFPGFGLRGSILLYDPNADKIFEFDPSEVDMQALGRVCVGAHNDWCMRVTEQVGASRLRFVAFIFIDSVEAMITEAERLLAGGIRAVMLPAGVPPAGMSPADRRLDPFWQLMAETDTAVTMHVGTEFPLLSSAVWGQNVPEFENAMGSSLEFVLQPYWGATVNFAYENYLTAMVLGGVFERHPQLRFGAIEVGAQWIGPLSERLDVWADVFHGRYYDVPNLSMKPSEYLNRNVRVAPYYFEDISMYLERYSAIANSYTFSSDYPHREGGKHTKELFYEKLRHHGPDALRRFFVENGTWLLPPV